jgi:hypothetical protein
MCARPYGRAGRCGFGGRGVTPSERTLDVTEVDFLPSEWTFRSDGVDFRLLLERTLECNLKTKVDFVSCEADFEMRPQSTLCHTEWTLEM